MIYTREDMQSITKNTGRCNKSERKSKIIKEATKQLIPSIMQAAVNEANTGKTYADVWFRKRDVKKILKTLPKNNQSDYREFCEFLEDWFKAQGFFVIVWNYFDSSKESHIYIDWEKFNDD